MELIMTQEELERALEEKSLGGARIVERGTNLFIAEKDDKQYCYINKGNSRLPQGYICLGLERIK